MLKLITITQNKIEKIKSERHRIQGMESESLRKMLINDGELPVESSIVSDSKLEYKGSLDIISMIKHNRLIDLYKLLRRMKTTDCLY